jgi:hypothetical protein
MRAAGETRADERMHSGAGAPNFALIVCRYDALHSSRTACSPHRPRQKQALVQEILMNFYPSLSLFFAVGIAMASLACLLAIAVREIDERLMKRACEKALAAREARRAQYTQRMRAGFETTDALHAGAREAA